MAWEGLYTGMSPRLELVVVLGAGCVSVFTGATVVVVVVFFTLAGAGLCLWCEGGAG